ncbi:DUF5677 domain-containing protein [Sulfitobacter sp. HGT1]|uniref:DUF5677 domain-containing protein n=1 Tax=Sulfitobacter sp. HGT1 TaxID=2735435 RepID=UPI001594E054|nr:DUF5677 domain-containing protein [Sulfitobacter sp. HGT1]
MSGGYDFEAVQSLIFETLIPETERIVFHKGKPADFEFVSLYLSMMEMAWGCLAMLDKRLGYHSYPILRQIVETFIEMKVLESDPSYLDNLRFRSARSKKKKFENAKKGNPYFSSLNSIQNLDNEISENESVIDKIEKKWKRRVSVEEKFRLAGMNEEYDGLYRLLSDHTHSNHGALVSRHVKFDAETTSFVAFNHGERSDFMEVTTSLHEYLSAASDLIRKKFL